MTRISTGTPEAHSEHVPGSSLLGIAFAVAIPLAIGIAGIVKFGWGAIDWPAAAAWGAAGAVAFLIINGIGRAMGLTRMDLLDLLGSMFAKPHSPASRTTGFIVHLINGALLGIVWAYGISLGRLPASWITGIAWGIVLWALGLLVLSSIGGVHPAIRGHREGDPGPAAENFGKMTPLDSLLGHAAYGVVLGWLYAVLRF